MKGRYTFHMETNTATDGGPVRAPETTKERLERLNSQCGCGRVAGLYGNSLVCFACCKVIVLAVRQ